MRAVSAALQTLLRTTPEETTAWCLKLKRDDGTIAAFTNHDRDLSIDLADGDGAVTYPGATVAIFEAISNHAPVGEIDETVVAGAVDDGAMTRADVVAGLWRGAEARLFQVDWTDLTSGVMKELFGAVASISVTDFGWRATIHGLKARWQQRIGRAIGQYCRAEFLTTSGFWFCGREALPADWQASTAYALGDFVRNPTFDDRDYKAVVAGTSGASAPTFDPVVNNTTVDNTVTWKALRAVQVAGTVAAIVDALTFQATGFTLAEYPDGWYSFGKLDVTGGLNAGVNGVPVIGWSSASGTVTLAEPLPFTLAVTDAVRLTAGCNKTLDQGVVNCTVHDQVDPAPNKGGFRGEERVVAISEQVEIRRGGAGSAGKK